MGVGIVSASASLVAALSAVATIGSFLTYLYFVQHSNANAAREEALALAETRRQVIADLEARLAASERRDRQRKRQIHQLEAALNEARIEAREHAYQMQRLYAAGLADVIAGLDAIRSDLTTSPPRTETALMRVRDLLEKAQPFHQGSRRRRR
jgi:hypothetical protein